MDSNDDRKLLQAYAESRSEEAFARLAARYGDLVFNTALRHTRSRQLAEDVTQAVFIVLSRQAATLVRVTSLGGWLHQTTLFASSHALRAESRRRRHERAAATQTAASISSNDPAWETTELIENEMHRLPAADRTILHLHYLEELTIPRAAERLKISEVAARKRLSRALQRLRDRLSKHGVEKNDAMLASSLLGITAVTSNVGATAVAGGQGGGAFVLAGELVRAIRLLAIKKAAAAVAVIGLSVGAIGITVAQIAAPPEKPAQAVVPSAIPPASRPATTNPGRQVDWRPIVSRFDEGRLAIRTLSADFDVEVEFSDARPPARNRAVHWAFDGVKEICDESRPPARLQMDRQIWLHDGQATVELEFQQGSPTQIWIYPGRRNVWGGYFSNTTFFGRRHGQGTLIGQIDGLIADGHEVTCHVGREQDRIVAVLEASKPSERARTIYWIDLERNAVVLIDSWYKLSRVTENVDELREVSPGVWLPTRFAITIYADGGAEVHQRRKFAASKLTINQPVGPEVFWLRIPARSFVQDHTSRFVLSLEVPIDVPDLSNESLKLLHPLARSSSPMRPPAASMPTPSPAGD